MFRSITSPAAALAAVALAAGVLTACGDEDDEVTATPAPATTPAQPAEAQAEAGTPNDAEGKLEELVSAPARFLGERITVTGEADGAPSAPAAFRLDGPRGDDGVVVLPTRAATGARDVTTGETVTVEGRVLEVNDALPDEAEFLFESDGQASATLAQVESRYVIAADRVTRAGG